MGYIRHDAIVVTSQHPDAIEDALSTAQIMGLPCSLIVPSPTNGFRSFLIAPDGSKEGWDSSKIGDARRAEWIEWVQSRYADHVDWAHVSFGGDEPEMAHLKNHSGKED